MAVVSSAFAGWGTHLLAPHFFGFGGPPRARLSNAAADDIIRANETRAEMMRTMKLILAVAMLWVLRGSVPCAAQGASPWNQPAAALADQIAVVLGPGEARLDLRNLSTIPAADLPQIRSLLQRDLKAHGVQISGSESANSIRITLSENARERLWVAEVVEGNEKQVVMVHVAPGTAVEALAPSGLTLRSQVIFTSPDPLLAVLETSGGLVVLEPEQIVVFASAARSWHELTRVSIGQKQALSRDPQGLLLPTPDGSGFTAWLAGTECLGSPAAGTWTITCHQSDDPWPLLQAITSTGPVAMSAFFNGARDYFTGIITPSPGVDLPPFYSAALIPRAAGGTALLIGGIDGKVQLLETSGAAPANALSQATLKSVAGTRDWGSDFALVRSGCGSGAQIIADASGEAPSDSLRAFDLPGFEAVPISTPLSVPGTVTALWDAPDGRSVLAIVRSVTNQYEVDRVSALCN